MHKLNKIIEYLIVLSRISKLLLMVDNKITLNNIILYIYKLHIK